MALRNTLVYDSENWYNYYFCFALSSGVFCFCVWLRFIETILSVIRVCFRWVISMEKQKSLLSFCKTNRYQRSIIGIRVTQKPVLYFFFIFVFIVCNLLSTSMLYTVCLNNKTVQVVTLSHGCISGI